MKRSFFEPCARSMNRAVTVLADLHVSPQEIALRRRAGLIADQAAFEELRHAFITPVDREDLLLAYQVCGQVALAAEDVTLHLYRTQRTVSPNDTALLRAVRAECEALSSAVAALPDYPKGTAALRHLTDTEKTHLAVAELTAPLCEPLYAVSHACFTAAGALRRVLLKMT